MKKIILGLSIIALFVLSLTSNAVVAQDPPTMEEVIGTDISEDFAVVVDSNVKFDGFKDSGLPSSIQVLKDLTNPSNPELNPVDEEEWYDQEMFVAHAEMGNVKNAFLAVNKIETNLSINPTVLDSINLGHINGTSPLQSLIQLYENRGAPVIVANTFRGFAAYETNATDVVIDESDKILLGYTLVEENFVNELNTLLDDNNLSTIPQYNYHNIYDITDNTSKTFGMSYENIFVVWQDTAAEPPEDLKSISTLLKGFEGVVTGGDLHSASVFEYINFTYTVQENTEKSNSTHTYVDVVTEYNVGPVSLHISAQDSEADFTNLKGNSTDISDANTARSAAFNISFQAEYNDRWFNVSVPAFSFYSDEAAQARLDATVVQEALGGNGKSLGLTAITSTNLFKLGTEEEPENKMVWNACHAAYYNGYGDAISGTNAAGTLNASASDLANLEASPTACYNWISTNIPSGKLWNSGKDYTSDYDYQKVYSGTFETSFVGKDNYRLYAGSEYETYGIEISDGDLSTLTGFFSGEAILSDFFEGQTKLTAGFATALAREFSPEFSEVTSATDLDMNVESTDYVTMVQMPVWNGLKIYQDPTYSAVAAVASSDNTTQTDTGGDTETTGNGGGDGAQTSVIPGFELLAILMVVPVVYRFRKKDN